MNPALLISGGLTGAGVLTLGAAQAWKWWQKRKAGNAGPAKPITFSADAPPSNETVEFVRAMIQACPGSDAGFRENAILSGWPLYVAAQEWSKELQARQVTK
jgi:hypothetical protein